MGDTIKVFGGLIGSVPPPKYIQLHSLVSATYIATPRTIFSITYELKKELNDWIREESVLRRFWACVPL
jgi:hypothetical protein